MRPPRGTRGRRSGGTDATVVRAGPGGVRRRGRTPEGRRPGGHRRPRHRVVLGLCLAVRRQRRRHLVVHPHRGRRAGDGGRGRAPPAGVAQRGGLALPRRVGPDARRAGAVRDGGDRRRAGLSSPRRRPASRGCRGRRRRHRRAGAAGADPGGAARRAHQALPAAVPAAGPAGAQFGHAAGHFIDKSSLYRDPPSTR